MTIMPIPMNIWLICVKERQKINVNLLNFVNIISIKDRAAKEIPVHIQSQKMKMKKQ